MLTTLLSSPLVISAHINIDEKNIIQNLYI